jgi:hypothetical protein
VCYIQHDECLAGFLISKILFCVLVATVNGTSRNPGQPDVQTHGTNVLSTSYQTRPLAQQGVYNSGRRRKIFIVNGAAKA